MVTTRICPIHSPESFLMAQKECSSSPTKSILTLIVLVTCGLRIGREKVEGTPLPAILQNENSFPTFSEPVALKIKESEKVSLSLCSKGLKVVGFGSIETLYSESRAVEYNLRNLSMLSA